MRNFMNIIAIGTVVVGTMIFSGCQNAASMAERIISVNGGTVTTGVAGVVLRAPTKPVARPGEDDTAPLAGARIAVNIDGGDRIGVAVSDSAGHFLVELAAGNYILTPLPFSDQPFPVPPAPAHISVKSGQSTTVQFVYDTGIR